jgi:hypothetical protein
MPTEPYKPLIVIRYAHADEPEHPAEGEVKWLSFVTGYLRPAIKLGAVDIWIDRLMRGGAEWEREIELKLHACDIFILLVSRHSLSSDYVVDKEIAIIRERQAKGEDVHFYPLVLTPTPKIALNLVRDKNLRPAGGKPLSDYSINARYRHMSDAADEIAAIAAVILARTPTSRTTSEPTISDSAWIEDWLKGQRRDVAAAIAARAALRVVPLVAKTEGEPRFSNSVATILRRCAVARAAGKHPTLGDEFRDLAKAASIGKLLILRRPVETGTVRQSFSHGRSKAVLVEKVKRRPESYTPSERVDNAAKFAVDTVAQDAALSVVAGVAAKACNSAALALGSAAASLVMWEAVRRDVVSVEEFGGSGLSDLPLWKAAAPTFASNAWNIFKNALPVDQGWDLWVDWYEERLRGGSRGEAYDLVFARVPPEMWNKSPAAANAWIKSHLPDERDASRQTELPHPLPELDAPFAFGWTASQRVAAVTGAHNLAFYRYFSSEEDHRRALEAARVGGERLLKALRDGRYNARKEYGEALEYYLDDLPKIAGAGNILLANDQVRILHAMFLADAAMLPEGFASRLKSVIANQFALNAFYDLVQRHNEAVSAGNWSRPFPLEAAKGFFGVVEDNTPRWFEREVERGLRQVEQAEPPAVAPPEPAPASVIEAPQLPAGTPDAQNSWRRQMATAANALWETFLQGQNMPVAQDEWRAAADALGAHVRPIIDFLRAQEEGKG